MSFVDEIRKMDASSALVECVIAGYRTIVEASNTQIREAVKQGKRIAEADLVDNLIDECGGETVREYLTRNPWAADLQNISREELAEYMDGFRTRGSAAEPSRDKTMAEHTRDSIAAKILHFENADRGYAYLPGIVRIAVEDCFFDNPMQDNDALKRLSAFIRMLVTRYDLPNDCTGATGDNPFDRYLNEMTWDQIEAQYGREIDGMMQNMHASLSEYRPGEDDITRGGEYDIIRVHNFAEAQQYRDLDCPLAPMCIGSGRAAWDMHAANGMNTVYLCRRHDALDIPPEPGPDAPLDDYGLSAFYVIVDPDGDPVSITPRWNHAQEATDFSISPRLAADLVGMPFSEAFPPDPHEMFDIAQMGGGNAGMRSPRPRPADRPYQHGWHSARDYVMPRAYRRMMNMRMNRMG